ncbi:MAG TPA: exosortase A [bacterium]|nr:exosortase A [bacterium]
MAAAWVAGVAGALAILYARTIWDLVLQWRSDDNASHGFLIPFLSAYLIWERRDQLRRATARVAPAAFVLLLTGTVVFILGQAATFGYPSRLSLVISLAGLVAFLYGPQVFRLAAFPLAYLLFMIPLPVPLLNIVAFPLQLLAARTATTALDLMNVPVLRDGNIIDLPTIRLEVTEACSGIRSLVALLALAAFFAYLKRKTWQERLALTLAAIPIAIIANAARIATTGVLVQLFGAQAGRGFYHMFSGWVIFLVAFGLLAGTECLLPRMRPGGALS